MIAASCDIWVYVEGVDPPPPPLVDAWIEITQVDEVNVTLGETVILNWTAIIQDISGNGYFEDGYDLYLDGVELAFMQQYSNNTTIYEDVTSYLNQTGSFEFRIEFWAANDSDYIFQDCSIWVHVEDGYVPPSEPWIEIIQVDEIHVKFTSNS
ncbi:MAG: hypothetical protein ACXAEU_07210 [Candidatus Hodarchaeales archaeon]|jgi:hypothetical protein